MALSTDTKVLIGVGIVASALAVITAALTKEAAKMGIREAREAMFEVTPGCEEIHFRGGGDSLPTGAQMDTVRKHFFEPRVKEYLQEPGFEQEAEIHGVTVNELLAARILTELFPECPGRFPPESLFSTEGVIWTGMRFYLAGVTTDVQAEIEKEQEG